MHYMTDRMDDMDFIDVVNHVPGLTLCMTCICCLQRTPALALFNFKAETLK